MVKKFLHRSVMLDEAVAALGVRVDGRYVDGTFGGGGHSGEILRQLGVDGHLLAFDKDPQAWATAQELFGADARFDIVQGSFTLMGREIEMRGWEGRIDGVLLDLGVSSPQLDDAARGFSFRNEGPLDMRMDPHRGVSASAWLFSTTEDEIAQVLKRYGEERCARRIARAITTAQRECGPIRTTTQLAAIIAAAMPGRQTDKHPATRTFQALRIVVNDEINDLERCLLQTTAMVAPGGRLVVISFHSLEDRQVKRFMRCAVPGSEVPSDLPLRSEQLPRCGWRLVGKMIRPSSAELRANPRARSARLRVAERAA